MDKELFDALVDTVSDAMMKYGPDGHCDGAEDIAMAVVEWFRANQHCLTD